MNDNKKTQDSSQQSASPADVPDDRPVPSDNMPLAGESRRRFIKGAFAAAPVIMTVTSRPAWGNHCAPSGMVSGNISSPGWDPASCSTGNPPEYYLVDDGEGGYQLDGTTWPSTLSSENTYVATFDIAGLELTATLSEILTSTVDGQWQYSPFRRAAVTALANAHLLVPEYLSTGMVTHMVHDVEVAGFYMAAQCCSWNEDGVLAYFLFTWGEGPLGHFGV